MSNLQEFWKSEIRPLFTDESLEFLVETAKGRKKYLNFDNAATTTEFRQVRDRIANSSQHYGSVHRGNGQKSKISTEEYDKTRDSIRNFVGASKSNYVVFTTNTTTAVNQLADLMRNTPGKVLVSDIEHSSNLLPWLKNGELVQYKTREDGTFDLEDIESILREEEIKLIAITGSSNVTGYKPPIHDIAELAHKYGVKIFADVCQLIQHQKVEVLPDDDLRHLDFIAFSGHKMYAPYGTGVLIGPKSFFDTVYPYQIGGGNITYITRNLRVTRLGTEREHDAGTPNFNGAIAIEEAIEVIEKFGRKKIENYEKELSEYLYTNLKKIPGLNLYVNDRELGSVFPFDLEGIDSKLVAEILAVEYGIGVRAGSFCTYELNRKNKKISDYEDEQISRETEKGITKNVPSVVRASLSLVNNPQDIDSLVKALSEISRNGIRFYQDNYSQDEKTGNWKYIGDFENETSKSDINYHKHPEEYEEDIVKSIPGYHDVHLSIRKRVEQEFENIEPRVLELGPGIGTTTKVVLEACFPRRYLAIERDEEMLRIAREELEGKNVEFVLEDYSKSELPDGNDLVITCIGFHHQESNLAKRRMLEKVYDSLTHGSLLVFADLVTYRDQRKAALSDAKHYHFLVEQFRDDERRLTDWAHHHKFLNKLATLEQHLDWMKEIGFREIEIGYERFNTALIYAKK